MNTPAWLTYIWVHWSLFFFKIIENWGHLVCCWISLYSVYLQQTDATKARFHRFYIEKITEFFSVFLIGWWPCCYHSNSRNAQCVHYLHLERISYKILRTVSEFYLQEIQSVRVFLPVHYIFKIINPCSERFSSYWKYVSNLVVVDPHSIFGTELYSHKVQCNRQTGKIALWWDATQE